MERKMVATERKIDVARKVAVCEGFGFEVLIHPESQPFSNRPFCSCPSFLSPTPIMDIHFFLLPILYSFETLVPLASWD